jgi:REP element-mobilizing transposase RayT
MPDHLHVLIEGSTEHADLLKCTAMFRQRSGRRYRQLHDAYLWQEGYVDRLLRKDDATLDVVRYIIANPLRAGLCRDVREYPYVGSRRYSIEEIIDSLA